MFFLADVNPYIPAPSFLNSGDTAWQLTAATFVGMQSIPGLAILYAGLVKKKWADAEKLYNDILQRYPETAAAPEALYWAGVSRYSASHDASKLGETGTSFKHAYQQSIWAKKASVWGG